MGVAGKTCFLKGTTIPLLPMLSSGLSPKRKSPILCRAATGCRVSYAQKKTELKLGLLAVRRGLEPLTPCVTGTYSNQLN